MNRRTLLKSTGLAVLGSTLMPFDILAKSTETDARLLENSATGKRKLGKNLEVSAIGIGVQNMSRTYQTTIPTRTEMHNIIHKAFDNGVTFFDAAEAYGPHEVERILGEGIASFRDKITVATKFGWNIDLETGKRNPGLNSKPEHI